MKKLVIDLNNFRSHVGVFGDTGSGKTLLMMQIMAECERLGYRCIVWDPDRQFTQKFRRMDRGDWVIDPTVEECPYWDIGEEYKDEGEAMALATCFFPDNPNVKDPFWNNSARGLMAYLMAAHRPTISDLALWCANDHLLDGLVAGSEYERILAGNVPGMRASILSHMNQIAQPLRMMPQHPDGRRKFSVRDYCDKRNSWVFITGAPQYAKILNPLHVFFLSSFIQRFIASGPRPDLTPVVLIIEEASSVVVQEFHTALIRLRKTRNPVVYNIQNYSDLKANFGADTGETIYSQAFYKVFLRTGSGGSAKQACETIGNQKVAKMRESWQQAQKGIAKYTRSFSVSEEVIPVVDTHELQNLPDRDGYIISPGKISKFRLPVYELPDRLPMLVPREIPPLLRAYGTPVIGATATPAGGVHNAEVVDTPALTSGRLF